METLPLPPTPLSQHAQQENKAITTLHVLFSKS